MTAPETRPRAGARQPRRDPEQARAEKILKGKRSSPAQRLEALKLIVDRIETDRRIQDNRAGEGDLTRYGPIQKRGEKSMEQAFTYRIEEKIATLSQRGDTSKELNLVSYSGSPAKYDLRSWKRADGEERLLKGITLSAEEAKALKEALNARPEL